MTTTTPRVETSLTVGGDFGAGIRASLQGRTTTLEATNYLAGGLQKIFNTQAHVTSEIKSLDAAGVAALAEFAKQAATRASQSAEVAASAEELTTAAQPLLEAVHRIEAKQAKMEAKQAQVEAKQNQVQATMEAKIDSLVCACSVM